MTLRYGNGVKVRADGGGDQWANEHRRLGREFYIQDLDGMFGSFGWASNTADRLFEEYVADNYVNRVKKIRSFGLVAMFDRKQTRHSALGPANTVSTAFYLENCRVWGDRQGIDPKFFYVVGKSSPWEMIELDIRTADEIHTWTLRDANWRDVWEAAGLVDIRARLESRMSRAINERPIDLLDGFVDD